jgi:hypothetical protein
MPDLEELMCWMVDTVLKFDDGELQCNSAVLGMCSSVLRGAVEAASSSNSSSSGAKPASIQIPMQGATKEEWLETAAFWYPVVPAPLVAGWEQAELLLKVAARYDIQCVLHKVDLWLSSKASYMKASSATAESKEPPPADSVWRWLHLADKSGLTVCLPAIARRAVELDRAGCSSDKLQQLGLSNGALLQMVAALAASPAVQSIEKYCSPCYATRSFKLTCTTCRRG